MSGLNCVLVLCRALKEQKVHLDRMDHLEILVLLDYVGPLESQESLELL